MQFDALIIIDMQPALVEAHPRNIKTVVDNIRLIAQTCRSVGVPVVYITHTAQTGELVRGSRGWTIYADIAPQPGEAVFEKRHNSAFLGTELRAHLSELGAKKLILCGMQTERCVDTTLKVAYEYGFDITVAKGTVATFDCAIATGDDLTGYYLENIWKDRFAHIVAMPELIQALKA